MTQLTLLVGEICVDVTLANSSQGIKMRLGGIVHAARGFWALDQPFAVAAFFPSYLEQSAREYLKSLGCLSFHKLGEIKGAPNVTLFSDATELADQGYETLLRDEKSVSCTSTTLTDDVQDILIFPGTFDLKEVCDRLPFEAKLHLDVAYDLDSPGLLTQLPQSIETVMISTSSTLFLKMASGGFGDLVSLFRSSGAKTIVLKENRGGARLSSSEYDVPYSLPAQLGETVNSVGVGDVFAAAYLATLLRGEKEAGWRATYAAAAYSQTTFPEIFKANVQRDQYLSLAEMEDLGGVALPWEHRKSLNIYLAGPDFTYVDRRFLQKAIDSLTYHNFNVRRPILENGQMPIDSTIVDLRQTFHNDCALLAECDLVFAVPSGRDPGTLVEVGIAIKAGIPVVVYDPERENKNTMVVAGANHYSIDLDSCLNATFFLLARVRSEQ